VADGVVDILTLQMKMVDLVDLVVVVPILALMVVQVHHDKEITALVH
jgi:hypothetical protein